MLDWFPSIYENIFLTILVAILFIVIHLAFIVRAIVRPHREPASRVAWVVVIVILPAVGILAYILLGETNIGRRRVERMNKVIDGMSDVANTPGLDAKQFQPEFPVRYEPLFKIGKSVNGFDPLGGIMRTYCRIQMLRLIQWLKILMKRRIM